jgi:ATP-dependent DNA ligase
MPDFSPARLQLVKALPRGRGWVYEPKFDGYRGLVSREVTGRVRVISRNEKDLTRWFPELVRVAEALPLGTTVDGEIVSPTENGVSFTQLQRRLMTPIKQRARVAAESPVALVAFDVLMDRKENTRQLPLSKRRKRLQRVVERAGHPLLQVITQITDADAAMAWLDDGLSMPGIEGVVAKRDESYPRPNVKRWQKVRRLATMDVLVRGYAGEPTTPRLVVAVQDAASIQIIGTTLPLGTEDALALRSVMQLAVPTERPLWAPFDSGRLDEWYELPLGLAAEIAYTNLDGHSLRHAARFVRWKFSKPPEGS